MKSINQERISYLWKNTDVYKNCTFSTNGYNSSEKHKNDVKNAFKKGKYAGKSYFIKYSLAYINFNLHISIQIILILGLYFILLMLFRCITKKDILWFIEDFKYEPICVEWNDLSIYKRF